MNKFLNKLNMNIGTVWKTPSGLILEQKYMKTESKKIRTTALGKMKAFNITKPLNVINVQKQNYSIVPNLIHSLDAANISILINYIINNGNKINLLTIHDCFATDANNIEYVNLQVKLAFLCIYQNKDFLINFHNYAINHLIQLGIVLNKDRTAVILDSGICIEVPKLPDFNNNFDLKYNLLNSPYFIN